MLVQSHTPRQDIAADMLSLLNDGRYPTLDLTPQQRRQKTLEERLVASDPVEQK
jgi:hypothetical protein